MNGESVARPEIVMNKLLDLINHQKSKNMSFPSKESNHSKIASLLSNASSYPYKIMYVCQNGKYNPKNTTHKEIDFWVEHPELRPPSNQNKKKYNKQEHEAETHQTRMSALLTRRLKTSRKTNSIVVDCGATHHMLNNKELFSDFVDTKSFNITTSNSTSNIIATGQGRENITANNTTLTLHNCVYVPDLSQNLVSLL
ncbi:hypothetical protein O181_046447 [Austropuccinia psidii MF-1]|uniref:Retrovirus-related Pol polyprotein from transposon TNT 1-94-like beta-barrel domain-containing protein n=1 Tax=Austropuccinia psidii MF-1 TaxID=1389203 RepID=A0A9Q3DVV3_9BASI|nr:hypothetical protein [Austropuccinia psidii MF-1]